MAKPLIHWLMPLPVRNKGGLSFTRCGLFVKPTRAVTGGYVDTDVTCMRCIRLWRCK